MFRSIEDFQRDWAYESEATRKVLHALTDSSLGQRVYAEGRSLGRIAWHLVRSIVDFGEQAKLEMTGPDAKAPIPSADQIVTEYERAADAIGKAVASAWNDSMLPGEIEMFGQQWSRGSMLSSLIRHQAHHRGQMTVLMRQADLAVPGVYGPAREEWKAYGQDPEE